MPILSPEQKASMRAIKSDNYPDRLDIYRPPAVSGKKRGDVVIEHQGQPCRRWPASKAPQIVAKVPVIAGARVDELIFFPDSVDVRYGDELRDVEGAKLKIEGVGVWQTAIAVAASLVVPS
jgi:hypothetical protein